MFEVQCKAGREIAFLYYTGWALRDSKMEAIFHFIIEANLEYISHGAQERRIFMSWEISYAIIWSTISVSV